MKCDSMKCPNCGYHLPTRAKKATSAELVHPGLEAPLKVLYAYYRAIAPREDLLFIRRNASPALQNDIDQLLASNPTAKDAERMRDRRRIELAQAARAEQNGSQRPEQYKDWAAETVTHETCQNCGRPESSHENGHCPRDRYGPYRNEDDPPTTFERSDSYTVWAWRMVPAAEFEAKFRRVAG